MKRDFHENPAGRKPDSKVGRGAEHCTECGRTLTETDVEQQTCTGCGMPVNPPKMADRFETKAAG